MNDFPTSSKQTISVVSGGNFDPETAAPLPWLWEPYLAFGAVSILDGDPGVAKSLIAIDIAARYGSGQCMPDGSPPAVNPATGNKMGVTIFVNSDDSVRHIQVPRLLTAGGQPRLAFFVGGIGEEASGWIPFRLPDHYPFLAKLLCDKLDLRGSFVVLDPVMALFPRLGTSDSAARAALDPLVRLAARSQCCILLVRHLNKKACRRSLYRGGGSIGIAGACRTVLFAGEHPDDPERKILAQSKNNLAPIGPSLGLHVYNRPERFAPMIYTPGEKDPLTGEVLKEPVAVEQRIPAGPAVAWDGPTPISADDLADTKRDVGAKSVRAIEWLRALLSGGPVAATEVEAKAQSEGIAYRTLQFAKKAIGAESRRSTVGGQPCWEWVLPQHLGAGPELKWDPDFKNLPLLDDIGNPLSS